MLLCSPLVGQETYPKQLTGFLQNGMKVGLKSYVNNPNMDLTIFSEKQFATVIAAHTETLEKLAEGNEEIASQAKDAIESFRQSLPERIKQLPPGKTYAEPTVQLSVPRLFYATIVHVGEDYVLLKYDEGKEKDLKQAIALHRISRIRWYSGKLTFNVNAKVVEK
ncbi:MAG TPA: hypothetical protein DDW52_18390 [Planctomycetaceae bacterium]|nr:hypothetical protein [Planctomycetaceae bacterium]